MPNFDRRSFLALAATVPALRRSIFGTPSQQPVIEVRPTALFQQPDGRKNLARITVAGLSAPARPRHPAETVDAVLARLDSHRRWLYRSPGTRARDPSPQPRCGGRPAVEPSRFSIHRRVRTAGPLLFGESIERGG